MVARRFRRALVASVVAGGASVAGGCAGDSEPGPADPNAGAPETGTGGAEAPSSGGRAASVSGGAPATGGKPAASTGGADRGGSADAGASSAGAPASAAGAGRSSAAGGASGGSSAARGGASAAPGTGGRDPECPDSLSLALLPASRKCSKTGLVCSVPVDCNTGSQLLSMTCENQVWEVPKGCDEPFNFCVDATGPVGDNIASADCEEGSWAIEWDLASFGPIPCPGEPPADDMSCDAIGGTESNGDRKHCGYPCSSGEGRSVISCTGEGADAKWLSDGACD